MTPADMPTWRALNEPGSDAWLLLDALGQAWAERDRKSAELEYIRAGYVEERANHDTQRARAERAEADLDRFQSACTRQHSLDLEVIGELRDRTERAEAELVERRRIMKHGSCSGVIDERDALLAALARVRALCDNDTEHYFTLEARATVRAAIEGDK